MYEQINTQHFVTWSKQFSNATLKANQAAIAGFERAIDLQLKALEKQTKLASEFFADLGEARDAEALQALVPKSAEIFKQATDHAYSVSQALVDNAVKTNEQIGEIVRGQIETVQAQATKAAPVAKKAAR
jgi:phasin family protein